MTSSNPGTVGPAAAAAATVTIFGRSQSLNETDSGWRIVGTRYAPLPVIPRRTTDNVRRFNLHNVFRETARSVNAGVQNAISFGNLLNRSTSVTEPITTVTAPPTPIDPVANVVVTVDMDVPPDAGPNSTSPEPAANPANNNNNVDGANQEPAPIVMDEQQFLQMGLKYLPFVLILCAKALYDYYQAMFIFIVLLATFIHSNSTVKSEALKRHKRNKTILSVELLYIIACLAFVRYMLQSDVIDFNIWQNLVLIKTFNQKLTIAALLWIVIVTDFVLKLLTVSVKILVILLPGSIIPFQKRGKYYFFVEALSQMYRSIVTIQPWLYYLLESYQDSKKIIAVFLSAFYMVSKGSDLMSKLQLLKTAVVRLLQDMSVGVSPTKEQIQLSSENCPICHDAYQSPVLLQCRHIFCENCVMTWFDREQTCPLCRAKIVDDPLWKDGSTTHFIQLY